MNKEPVINERQLGPQRVKGFASALSGELCANFGEPELGSVLPVSDHVNLWFGRAGLQQFIEVAGTTQDLSLPRLLQVHIYPIEGFDDWPQLSKLIGDNLGRNLQQLQAEALSKPAVKLGELNDKEFEEALNQAVCKAEFQADELSRQQIEDILRITDPVALEIAASQSIGDRI